MSSWIDFWQQHLRPTNQIIFEDQRQITGLNLWEKAEKLKIGLKKAGCNQGKIVASINSGSLLFRDILAVALAEAIIQPVSLKNKDLLKNANFLIKGDNLICLNQDSSTQFTATTTLLLYTSGTLTGNPTLIPLTSEGLISQITTHANVFANEWERKRLSILPHNHAFGLILDLMLGVYQRQQITINNKLSYSLKQLLKTIQLKQIEIMATVPRILEIIQTEISNNTNYRKLHIHVGGANLRPYLKDKIEKSIRKLSIGYGLTEAGPGVLIDGKPVNCQIKLLGKNQTKILYVSSPSLSPVLKLDKQGYFSTNDLANFNEDGTIEVIGRASKVIKDTNGKWLELTTLEHELLKFPEIITAKIYLQDSKIRVCLITSRANSNYCLNKTIKNFIENKTNRLTEVVCSPFTNKDKATLVKSTSKNSDILLTLRQDG